MTNNVIVIVRCLVSAITALSQYYYSGVVSLRALLLGGYFPESLEKSLEISFYPE
jgi:hypothetical protein